MSNKPRRILLTGGTGYVGGRLVPRLEAREDLQLRCLARRPEYLRGRVAAETEIVAGDVLQADSLAEALQGVHTAYYLIHSLGTSRNFEQEEIRCAGNFARAAQIAGVRRIIYLGGLGDEGGDLSPHLQTRQQVGRKLRESGAEVLEFRASIIIGSGSLSFEMIRALVQKLPVMTCPSWVRTPAQPISIEDVLAYLLAALDLPEGESRVYEIGGPDVVSYQGIMEEYARQRGLKRWMVPVPFLSPGLSSRWLGLVTPIYARVGRKLVESLRNPTVVTSDRASRDFDIRPRGLVEAISRALAREDRELAETRWSDAVAAHGQPQVWGGVKFGNQLVDTRTVTLDLPAEAAFAPIERLGGNTGYYFGDWLWWLRGFLDLLAGGVGSRRGRRDPDRLLVGDAVDFWRVEQIERPSHLRLSAEMKLPGRAWLDFQISEADGRSTIRQTAIFDPIGLSGLLYWYSVWPLHELVFRQMLRGIARAARQRAATRPAAGNRPAEPMPLDSLHKHQP